MTIFITFTNECVYLGPLMLRYFLFFFFVGSVSAHAAEIQLCSDVHIRAPEKLSFSNTEKRWVCGDSKNPAWQTIPIWQKEFYLKNFLQSRGYHKPEFSTRDGQLFIDTGAKSHLKSWTVSEEIAGFKSHKRRAWIGRDLTPALLNEMESWSKSRLGEVGYPCAKASAQASPETAEVFINLEPGPFVYFISPHDVHLPNQDQLSSINRYAAFSEGRVFDERLLKLSANRMVLDEYILSSFFEVTCDGTTQIIPRIITGDPQIVAAGGGYNTELGVIGQIRYKHTHLDKSGSNFQSTLLASQRYQSFENKLTLYRGEPYENRYFWRPTFDLINELEAQYEALTASLGVKAGFTHELEEAHFEFSGGPSYVYNEVQRSESKILRTVSLETEFLLQSHEHEYYMGNPFTGWTFSLTTFSGFKNLGASQNFHQINFSGQSLWNLGDWTPPMAILGLRFKTGTFILEDIDNFSLDIPESYRFFLGGDASLRGFGRKQIQGSETGVISYFYTGIELREGEVFWGKIQPFIFVDLGWIGENSFTVNPNTYWSPGVGFRWPTIIGPVRASLSRGYINSTDDPLDNGFVIYFSLGSEF